MAKLSSSTVEITVRMYLRCITGELDRYCTRRVRLVQRIRKLSDADRAEYYVIVGQINREIDGVQEAIAVTEKLSDWGWMAQ